MAHATGNVLRRNGQPAGRSAFSEQQGTAVLRDDTMETHKPEDGCFCEVKRS